MEKSKGIISIFFLIVTIISLILFFYFEFPFLFIFLIFPFVFRMGSLKKTKNDIASYFCVNCGKKVSLNTNFCPHCGNMINGTH
ncbi:MAG: zinc-ribbon domain-containing protein [Candidatus Hodarchaeales archaeon]